MSLSFVSSYTFLLLGCFGTNDASCPCCKDSYQKASPCPRFYTLTNAPKMCIRHWFLFLTWTEARKFCQKDNADLVALPTRRIIYWFEGILDRVVHRPLYWLALNRRGQGADWNWNVDSQKKHHGSGYIKWALRHPQANIDGQKAECTTFTLFRLIYYATPCMKKHRFMCQLKIPQNSTLCPDSGHVNEIFDEICEKTENGKVISKTPENSRCPDGWARKAFTRRICLKVYEEEVTWREAVKTCQENNSTLLTIESKNKFMVFKLMREVWVGLNDRKEEMEFHWLDDEGRQSEVFDANWGGFPIRNVSTNCFAAIPGARMYNTICNNKLPFFCLKESLAKGGPGSIHLEMVNPRQDKILFLNELVEFTCTALGTETGVIHWTMRYWDFLRNSVPSNANITQEHALVETEAGQCRNQTISRYRFRATQKTANVYLSCFSDKGHRDTCPKSGMTYQFCDRYTGLTNPVVGPKRSPVLKVEYKGFPAPIESGNTLKVTCSAYTLDDGTLLWAFANKHNVYALDPFTNQKPKIHSIVSRDPEHGRLEESVLELNVERFMSGITIACFAYNIVLYEDTPKCYDADEFCAKTKAIQVQVPISYEPEGSKSAIFLIIGLLLVFLVGAAALLKKYGTQEDAKEEKTSEIKATLNNEDGQT